MNLKKLIITIAVVIIIVMIIYVIKNKPTSPTGENTSEFPSDKVKVDFYVMSQCPYGLQVENGFKPVLDKFGEAIEFRLEFIGLEKDGKFQSLHGETEINGNKVQLCAQKHEPDKFMEMVVCMNKDIKKIPGNWEDCVEEMNKEKIKECYEGEEGTELLKASFEKAQEINAKGSPTMHFNEELYAGNRDEESFTRAVCRLLDEHELCEDISVCEEDSDCPAEGTKIPVCENPGTKEAKCSQKEDAKVEVILLTSKKCFDCDVSAALQELKQLMPNLEGKELDIDTESGKEIIEKYNITKIPAMIFSKTIKETLLWKTESVQMKNGFDEFDDALLIKGEIINAHFFVDEEKRKKNFEDLGIKLKDNKPQIDFFVMSYCPYGNLAEEGIAPVYELLGDKAEFNPHYVIYSNYQGGGKQFCFDDEDKYCSMHGVQEMTQGVRELCVAKHMGMKEYFEYVTAMNEKSSYKNADEKWEEVAKEIGLDTTKIKKCFETEANEILAEELKLNKAYGAKGSPQIFIDGTAYNGGRTPENYKQALCNAFDDAPTECNTKLDAESKGPEGSC